MSSKFIPRKGPGQTLHKVPKTWLDMGADIWTHGQTDKQNKKRMNQLMIEKARIEAIPLDQLKFTDLYKLPFRKMSVLSNWIYDSDNNFCFQFERGTHDNTNTNILSILNGETKEIKSGNLVYSSNNGDIFITIGESKPHHLITIRGWGNLTGVGSYNLNSEHAAKIQDTLADWIVETLNNAVNNE